MERYVRRDGTMKSEETCEICGALIPRERLEILPETRHCVKCSQAKPYSTEEALGFSVSDEDNRPNMEDYEEESEFASSEF